MDQREESVVMDEPSFTAANGSFEENFDFQQEQEPMVFEEEPLIDFNDESILHADETIEEPACVVQEEMNVVEPVVEEEKEDADGFTKSTLDTIAILRDGFVKTGELSFGELNVKVCLSFVND
jgi:hypothetical protein